MGPGVLLLLPVRPAALQHVGLSHIDPDYVVNDLIHDRIAWAPRRASDASTSS